MNLLDSIANLFRPSYPTQLYPTVLEGEIWGPVRCESLDGSEMYLYEDHDQQTSVRFINFKPFEKDGKTWGVSNIQKKSKSGWIKTDPKCYYSWEMSKLQDTYTDKNGAVISVPGTEKGWYFRQPLSWRRQINPLEPWVWSKGYLGRHFD